MDMKNDNSTAIAELEKRMEGWSPIARRIVYDSAMIRLLRERPEDESRDNADS
jgi:hypothetical protein